MSVCLFVPVYINTSSDCALDFLSVRKIPLKERNKLPPPDSSDKEDNDPEVQILLRKMRDVILKDRDLHDKVLQCLSADF